MKLWTALALGLVIGWTSRAYLDPLRAPAGHRAALLDRCLAAGRHLMDDATYAANVALLLQAELAELRAYRAMMRGTVARR